jgi:alginate O-acetyltransferase complex protein AlgI
MLYSNVEFLIFFAVVFGLFLLADNSPKKKMWLLGLSSVFFYIWAGFGDFLIFVFVVFVSWGVVWWAEQSRFEKAKDQILLFGIVLLTANLFFWKYSSWVVQAIQCKYPQFLYGNRIEVILPVGVSFFTLQGLAYLIDYRRGTVAYLSFQQVFLTKSFFPQLIAGPIVRMQQLAPQLNSLNRLKSEDTQIGLAIFLLGFFKKVAIADRMGGVVDPVFNDPSAYTVGSIVLALIAYTIQIWADFSGYTDMGRGTARMLGVNLPENFLTFILASSISSFDISILSCQFAY